MTASLTTDFPGSARLGAARRLAFTNCQFTANGRLVLAASGVFSTGPPHCGYRSAPVCQARPVATILRTTLTPSKLDLLTTWLPQRSWYRGAAPALRKAGGFRLDDPDGDVGVEVLVVEDADGDHYVVPLTYRGAPLPDAGEGLVGTAEHGVLGRRWIYDGAHDPVAVAQMLALVTGEVQAQRQDVSDTTDPTVRPAAPSSGPFKLRTGQPLAVVDAATRTSIALRAEGLSLNIVRVLDDETAPDAAVVAAVEVDVPGVGRRAVLTVLRR